MTTDSDIFYGFVFDDKDYPPKCLEQATRAVQRQLGSSELRRVNDTLLARLALAKEARPSTMTKKQLLDDPAISTLVNTLALVNQAWITTVIDKNIKSRPHLHRASVEELHSAALTGAGTVGGVMRAILEYDYNACGVDAFSSYLARAITNALLPTRKLDRTYQRVEVRTRPLHEPDEHRAGRDWVDRAARPPEAAAINRELLEVVQSVIPRLPSPQHRFTADWMIGRILATGELPLAREVAHIQRPRVSRERGLQILEATVNNIRRQIEADYPQLAEQGINGWEQFKKALTRAGQTASPAGIGNGR